MQNPATDQPYLSTTAVPAEESQRREPFFSTSLSPQMVVGGVIVLVGLLLFSSRPTSTPDQIGVTGYASQKFPIGEVTISLLITSNSSTKDIALSTGKSAANNVINVISPLQPVATAVSAHQVAPLSSGTYEYRQGVEVVLESADQVPEVLAAANNSNVTVAQVRYQAADQVIARQTLSELVLKDAESKAGVLAREAGKQLGGVMAMVEVTSTGGVSSGMSSSKLDSASLTTDQASEVELDMTYNVTYKLKPWWQIW